MKSIMIFYKGWTLTNGFLGNKAVILARKGNKKFWGNNIKELKKLIDVI